jgi:hypothetical protein
LFVSIDSGGGGGYACLDRQWVWWFVSVDSGGGGRACLDRQRLWWSVSIDSIGGEWFVLGDGGCGGLSRLTVLVAGGRLDRQQLWWLSRLAVVVVVELVSIDSGCGGLSRLTVVVEMWLSRLTVLVVVGLSRLTVVVVVVGSVSIDRCGCGRCDGLSQLVLVVMDCHY